MSLLWCVCVCLFLVHYKMETIENLCSQLYPTKCCHDILINYTIHNECLLTIFVKTLGYGIIFGSTLVKVPQIVILFSAKSGEGVSLFSVLLELVALTFTSSYSWANSFPISAWGEALFLMAMTCMVTFLILLYDQSRKQATTFLLVYLTIVYLFMSGQVPIRILWFFQVLNVPLIISSKVVQACANFRNGHTGNLSAITVCLIFVGSIIRIFTSIRETGDAIIVLGYILSTVTNLVLVYQIVFYWNTTKLFKEKALSKKTK